MSYLVKDIFYTLQGEGVHAGTAAIFVRLAGCNMWNGKHEDRQRDAARNSAHCPLWCDTDFVGGKKMTAAEIVDAALSCSQPGTEIVVLTGGEPLLQVDEALLTALSAYWRPHIETNGTVPFDLHDMAWVTMSPKRPREMTKLRHCHELKLVYPAHDPSEWIDFDADARFLQPMADITGRNRGSEADCVEYVKQNPEWRLSLQTHKVLNID